MEEQKLLEEFHTLNITDPRQYGDDTKVSTSTVPRYIASEHQDAEDDKLTEQFQELLVAQANETNVEAFNIHENRDQRWLQYWRFVLQIDRRNGNTQIWDSWCLWTQAWSAAKQSIKDEIIEPTRTALALEGRQYLGIRGPGDASTEEIAIGLQTLRFREHRLWLLNQADEIVRLVLAQPPAFLTPAREDELFVMMEGMGAFDLVPSRYHGFGRREIWDEYRARGLCWDPDHEDDRSSGRGVWTREWW